MTPHLASELLEKLLNKQLEKCVWPKFDPKLAELSDVEIAIQICGKLRATITTAKGAKQETVEAEARKTAEKWLEGKTIIKVVFVPDRLINFVVK